LGIARWLALLTPAPAALEVLKSHRCISDNGVEPKAERHRKIYAILLSLALDTVLKEVRLSGDLFFFFFFGNTGV
jgi:hypothetical protein